MTTSIIPNLEKSHTAKEPNQESRSSYCTLHWRRGQLLVLLPGLQQQPLMPLLEQKQSLTECLKKTQATRVRVDPKLGTAKLLLWADACEAASKPMFLRIPSANKNQKIGVPLFYYLKRLTEWLAAIVLFFLLSPLMLTLAFLLRLTSDKPIFVHQWHVGERGKVFRVLKFRTSNVVNDTFTTGPSEVSSEENIIDSGHWIRKYGLHNLPSLWNVIRGEMSLTGSRCWSLEESLTLSSEAQRQLNKLPGVMGSWQVETEPSLLHLDSQTL
ncbi:MAG: sugar transferase [Scytonematopsis contorta HA4267-MV1]|jgi:lipopolysaccharide/colanic/teichoic acid biosynthesis glycosyltransferase|nr:sugar transferase [Scytonematopsis contorta HA4267-MV1]